MNDYALDWLNIEYALNESEEILLSEFQPRPLVKPGKLGTAMIYATAGPAKLAADTAVNMGKSVINHDWHNVGKHSKIGLTDGRIFKSKLFQTTFWGRLLSKIRELWARFRNALVALFKSDNNFMTTELYNAEATIKNAIAEGVIGGRQTHLQFNNVYPFWEKQGEDYVSIIQVPRFNINDMRMLQSLDDKNTFINVFIRPLSRSVDFNDGNCINQLKTLFRGFSQPTSLSIQQIAPYVKFMVDYCANSNTLVNNIKREEAEIENAVNEVIREIRQTGLASEDFNQAPGQGNDMAQNIVRAKNYVSVTHTILGAKMTIVEERSRQIIGILRESLYRCKTAASKDDTENARMNHNIEQQMEENPEFKHEGKKKNFFNNFVGTSEAGKYLKKNDQSGKIQFTQEYMDSLPSDTKTLEKETERIQGERDNMVKFIKEKRIGTNDPRFEALYSYVQDYDKRLAALKQRSNMIQQ